MARTRIEDLPEDIKISRKEMGRIYGGVLASPPVKLASGGCTPEDCFDGDPRPSISLRGNAIRIPQRPNLFNPFTLQ